MTHEEIVNNITDLRRQLKAHSLALWGSFGIFIGFIGGELLDLCEACVAYYL
jgi:hypothetical protein